MSRKRGFLSKYSYKRKYIIMYGSERIMIPDEVGDNPSFYADEGIGFPGHPIAEDRHATIKGLHHRYVITDEDLRLRLERDSEDLLHFRVKWFQSRPPARARYWEIRCHIEGKYATVHVTKAKESRFWGQVWQAWDEKLVTPGLANDLEKIAPQAGEEARYIDPENDQFEVSIRVYDEDPKLPIIKLDYLRWSESAKAAWERTTEEIA